MAALGVDAADVAAVAALVRASGTSFYRGMRVLPPDRRMAMYGIYAFCRKVDDIVDGPGAAAEKDAALAAWRERIAGLYRGEAADPVCRVLLAAVQRYHLRQEDFVAVIDGMQMDADRLIVAPTWIELDTYCDLVASAVGRLSVRAFGDESERADDLAWALGRALQYTNILRDLAEDAARGRLYVPRMWLEAWEVPAEPAAALTHPNFPEVCAQVALMTRHYFYQAEAVMKLCDRRAMKPARLMCAGYRAVLDALERRGWTDLARKPEVGLWPKLRIAALSLLP